MKRILILVTLLSVFLTQISCKGVKSMSGTLTKSGSGGRRDYPQNEHQDYSKVQAPVGVPKSDTAQIAPATKSVTKNMDPASPGDTYRRDYGRVSQGSNGSEPNAGMVSAYPNAEANERLLKQYADMERLADLVLYELNIVERKWDVLLGKFKSAPLTEREKISADLDQLNADQLKLYKAHVKIYKEGKADWDRTKKEVEATLLSVRGISEK